MKKRVQGQISAIRDERKKIVREGYFHYSMQLPPLQWKQVPPLLDICNLEPFARLINADPGVGVTSLDFGPAFKELPLLLSAISQEHKSRIRPHIPAGRCWDFDSPPIDPLELATSVFQCMKKGCSGFILGWRGISEHHCKTEAHGSYSCRQFKYSHPAAEFAAQVVQVAGLDPKTAVIADMDDKDLRFGCSKCQLPMRLKSREKSAPGYTWRTMVHLFRLYLSLHS